MTDIFARDIYKAFGINDVLLGCNVEVFEGEKVGLIGANGSGKTTLFRIISGKEVPDKGFVQIPSSRKVGLLDQIPFYGEDSTAKEVLESAFSALMLLKEQLDTAMLGLEKDHSEASLNRYGMLQTNFEALGGYELQHRFQLVTQGLKIDADMQGKRFSDLSGGEKTRVNLGRIMLQHTDILLLDEPTNHLDIASVEWLENYIRAYKGTVVVISHDRYFLDRTVRKIIEIDDGVCVMYPGNYSAYAAFKEQKRIELLERFAQEQKKIKQLQEAVKRMHEWALRSDNPKLHKRAFGMEKRLNRMKDSATKKPKTEKALKAQFKVERFSGSEAVIAEDVYKQYGEKIVLSGANFMLNRGQSAALLGANGSGKTTILRILLGEIEPDEGFIKVGPSIKIGYLPQEVVFDHPERSMIDTIRYQWPMDEGKARNLLAGYGFTGEDSFKAVAKLSGGEKSRLRLLMLMQDEVNLLVLDEPTNHLDIRSRMWVEDAIAGFKGTMLFVSHDRYFIRRFANRILTLEKGEIDVFEGEYDDYREYREAMNELDAEVEEEQAPSVATVGRVLSKEKQRMIGSYQKKVAAKEEKIHTIEQRLEQIDAEMQNNPNDFALVQARYEEKEALTASLGVLYEEWMADQQTLANWEKADSADYS